MGCNNPSSVPMFGCCGEPSNEGNYPPFSHVELYITYNTIQTVAELNATASAAYDELLALEYRSFNEGPNGENSGQTVVRRVTREFRDNVLYDETELDSWYPFTGFIIGGYGMAVSGSRQMFRKCRTQFPGERGFCVELSEFGPYGGGFAPLGQIISSPVVDTLLPLAVTGTYEVLPPAFVPYPDQANRAIQRRAYISLDDTIPPPCNLAP